MIKTARDLAGGVSDMDLVMASHARNHGRTPLPSGEAAEPILKAEVNHGRWIAARSVPAPRLLILTTRVSTA